MVDGGGEFSFFQGTRVRTDIRIDISISIRPMTSKFGEPGHIIKQVLAMPSRQDYVITKTTMSPLPQCLWPPNLAEW